MRRLIPLPYFHVWRDYRLDADYYKAYAKTLDRQNKTVDVWSIGWGKWTLQLQRSRYPRKALTWDWPIPHAWPPYKITILDTK